MKRELPVILSAAVVAVGLSLSLSATTAYVVPEGVQSTPTPPYDTKATAAQCINDAVAYALSDDGAAIDIEGENLDCVAGYDGEAKSLPADIAVNGEPKGTVTMTYDESVGKWRASTPDAASGDTLKVTLHPDPAKPDVIQEDAVDEGEVV